MMLKSLPPTFWDVKVYERVWKTLSTLASGYFFKAFVSWQITLTLRSF